MNPNADPATATMPESLESILSMIQVLGIIMAIIGVTCYAFMAMSGRQRPGLLFPGLLVAAAPPAVTWLMQGSLYQGSEPVTSG